MALITRISRLFKADFHAVLDQVEEPEMLLRQAIREMEDDLSEAELRQHYRRDEVDELQLRRDELEQPLGEIDEELDVCFDSGEDDLARDLIRRKLQTQRLLKQVSTRFVATGKDLQRQQKALEENRAASGTSGSSTPPCRAQSLRRTPKPDLARFRMNSGTSRR